MRKPLPGGPVDELRAHLRERIAGYKGPRSFDFVDELPRTPSGKFLKHRLRRRYTTPAVPAAPDRARASSDGAGPAGSPIMIPAVDGLSGV